MSGMIPFSGEKKMKPNILIHVCCGPCAIIPVEQLQERFEVTGFWFNPNIHPWAEYEKRLHNAGYAFQRLGVPLVYDFSYNISQWFASALSSSDKKARCRACYDIRLSATAEYAALHGFSYFTTTMAQSLFQDFDSITAAGYKAEELYGSRFLPEDFRSYYREGKGRAMEWMMYRQNYCGCLFSEVERRGIGGKKFPKR
jgi:predicted adenine nucleotide alpha hydrolase (AANH) superfamily ATPase